MNLPWIEALRALTGEREASVAPIAIASVMSRGEDLVPLVGSRSPDRHAEGIGAVPLRLTAGELPRIEQAIPPGAAAGERSRARFWPTRTGRRRTRTPLERPGGGARPGM